MNRDIKSVRGMNDLLPADIGAWQRVENVLRTVAREYGYREIRTPILEKTELFTQSIGDQTDIVQKEMYTFNDGSENLALRPEATACTVRACNQHGLLHNRRQRLWYMGPMFRRERPQKGRYRQFHQFGLEAFGWDGPDIDAEVIRVGTRIWEELSVRGIELQLNTLGSPVISAQYRDALRAYFADHRAALDDDSIRRLDANPLRILDSKAPAMQTVIAGAPDIQSFLDDTARRHFDGLCESLTRSGIAFKINFRLVRGLDYYTRTVFEWVSGELGAQNAVCAGGRYDQLVETRGGSATPAVGFALGLERFVELARGDGDRDGDCNSDAEIYVVSGGDGNGDGAALNIAVSVSEQLRRAHFAVTMHCGGGALKKQMKQADQSGARIAVLVGINETPADAVQVKLLRGQRANQQQTVTISDLANWCREHL